MEVPRLRLTLAVMAALAAAPALAADPPGSDAPVSTAPAKSLSTAEQIDAFIGSSPAAGAAPDDERAGIIADDRKVHGVVSVGIGAGDYRSFYGRTDLPVGETGRLSIAIGQSKNDFGYDRPYYGRFGEQSDGPGYGGDRRSFGAALAFGGASPGDRQRCDLETMTPARRLDFEGGPNGRCRDALPPR